MTEGIRNGLGMLCIAAIALVIGLATTGGDAPLVSGVAILLAVALGVLGLLSIALGLFRSQ